MRQKHIPVLAIVALLFATALSSPDARAQCCKSFVRTNCIPQLSPYIHDGNYQAAIMSEGEEAEVYKPILAGQRYRLLICVDDALPNVEFTVSDNRRAILFDNRKNGNVKMWDFKADASQQIKITVKIPKSQKQENGGKESIFGCVAVIFGLLE